MKDAIKNQDLNTKANHNLGQIFTNVSGSYMVPIIKNTFPVKNTTLSICICNMIIHILQTALLLFYCFNCIWIILPLDGQNRSRL